MKRERTGNLNDLLQFNTFSIIGLRNTLSIEVNYDNE